MNSCGAFIPIQALIVSNVSLDTHFTVGLGDSECELQTRAALSVELLLFSLLLQLLTVRKCFVLQH